MYLRGRTVRRLRRQGVGAAQLAGVLGFPEGRMRFRSNGKTDITLSLSEIVQLYAGRWLVELLHWNLKVNLGLSDFRVRSLRGIIRYAAVCMTAQAFLEWRTWGKAGVSPADARNAPRALRVERLLRTAALDVRRGVRIQTIPRNYVPLLAA